MKLTLRQQGVERRKKAYELAKLSFKLMPKNGSRTEVYEKIAEEFGYASAHEVAKIYSSLRKMDKDPLPPAICGRKNKGKTVKK